MKIGKVLSGALTEDEVMINESRRKELWARLDPLIEGRVLTNPNVIKEVKYTILGYIAELEMMGEIPHGLTIISIEENPNSIGHLMVQFGLTSDCKQTDRERLMGFISGRLSLL